MVRQISYLSLDCATVELKVRPLDAISTVMLNCKSDISYNNHPWEHLESDYCLRPSSVHRCLEFN